MANLYKKTVYISDPQTGETTKTQSKKWYARYIDADGVQRRVALVADKKVAQKMLADLLQNSDRGVTTDPFAEAINVPIQVHLDDFEQHLQTCEKILNGVAPVRSAAKLRKPRIRDGHRQRTGQILFAGL